ncbi:MAG: hypothetical protein H0W56_00210 [Acidothermales bacterium]|jgi:hypothetical protein|nr:hypothetical protein [Acidothermales bacterium]
MSGVHAYKDFYASHDHMPGRNRALRVTGTVVFTTGGWSCNLRRTEGNTGINPRMLSLDLLLDPPDPAAGVPKVLTPCDIEWTEDEVSEEYNEVRFRVVGAEEEPPPVIPVEHPQ